MGNQFDFRLKFKILILRSVKNYFLGLKRSQVNQIWPLLFTPHHVPGVSDDVGESAAFEELHDDPEFVLDQVAVVHLDDVCVVVVPHDDNLQKVKLKSGCNTLYNDYGIQYTYSQT